MESVANTAPGGHNTRAHSGRVSSPKPMLDTVLRGDSSLPRENAKCVLTGVSWLGKPCLPFPR